MKRINLPTTQLRPSEAFEALVRRLHVKEMAIKRWQNTSIVVLTLTLMAAIWSLYVTEERNDRLDLALSVMANDVAELRGALEETSEVLNLLADQDNGLLDRVQSLHHRLDRMGKTL